MNKRTLRFWYDQFHRDSFNLASDTRQPTFKLNNDELLIIEEADLSKTTEE